jgi:hypothetical protein
MAEIRLRNRSGRSLKAGTYVRYHPTIPNALVASDTSKAEIIGVLKASSTNNSLATVELLGATGANNATEGIEEAFETVARNLNSFPYTFSYNNDELSSITYTTGAGMSVVKTFNYTDGVLTSIVLSGNTPNGIALTKTFTYEGDSLTGVTYS